MWHGGVITSLQGENAEDGLSVFFGDKHHYKTNEQRHTATPNGLCPKQATHQAAKAGADAEHKNNTEIRQRFLQNLFIPRSEIRAQCLGAGAHVADAHRACIRVAAHLVERLHLHGTYKRDHRVRKRFKVCRQKADDKQKHDLAEQNDLPPVDFLIRLKTNVYQLRDRCTDQK